MKQTAENDPLIQEVRQWQRAKKDAFRGQLRKERPTRRPTEWLIRAMLPAGIFVPAVLLAFLLRIASEAFATQICYAYFSGSFAWTFICSWHFLAAIERWQLSTRVAAVIPVWGVIIVLNFVIGYFLVIVFWIVAIILT